MPIKLDAIDRRILRALQRNSNQTNAELAQQAGLSPTPCLRRVHLLEEQGVIDAYVALLNPAAVDLRFTAFVRVTLERGTRRRSNTSHARWSKRPKYSNAT